MIIWDFKYASKYLINLTQIFAVKWFLNQDWCDAHHLYNILTFYKGFYVRLTFFVVPTNIKYCSAEAI